MRRPAAESSLLLCLALLSGCSSNGSGGGSSPPPAANQPPVASFTAPATIVAGTVAVLDARGSTDPEGGALSFHWTFGDGGRGGTNRIAHVFSDAGTYTVRLRAADPQGASHEATRTVTVTEPAATRVVTARGRVTAPDGAPLAGVTATVMGANATAQSDAQGRVSLQVAVGRAVALRFTKSGLADQTQWLELPAGTGADASFDVVMMPRAAAQTLPDAAEGGMIIGVHGARLTLPANALVTADGAAVTGAVQVNVTPVDINSAALAAFPGRFAGVNADGTRTPIVSYGTTEFVLTQDGAPLQLRAGARATLELPLYAASNLDASALVPGGTLPLWSLDERSGLWINEGSGTLVASSAAPAELALRAEVAHLSWWNADMGYTPFRPKPRCINDVPGQYDSIFEQATICRMLAEMDKPIPAQGKAAVKAVAPAYRFPATRITGDAPIAGGVAFDVPPAFDLVLTGTALNGTWRGQVRLRGNEGDSPDVDIPLRPVDAGGANEVITLPFDQVRAAAANGANRYRFQASAGEGVSILVEQSASTLTGWVRLRNAANQILATVPFGTNVGTIDFRLAQAGEYIIEIAALTNAPGAYRLSTTTQPAVERTPFITLTDATEIGIAKVAANGTATWALWPETSGTATRLLASRFIDDVAGWATPETVATVTGYATAVPVQLALDAAGNAFALWDMGTGPVVSRRPAAGNWSAPLALASTNCGGGLRQRLAVNDRGDAMVMWARPAAAGYCARRYTTSAAAWSTEQVIDWPQAQPVLSLDLAANGDAAAAWIAGGASGAPLLAQLARFRNGAWEAPVQVGGTNIGAVGVALGADGGLLCHWQTVARSVEAMWQPAGGNWTPVQTLGVSSGSFFMPRAVRRTGSRLQLVWWPEGAGLSSRELDTTTGIWGAPRAIAPARASSAAQVAASSGVVLWWASKLSGTGTDFGYSRWNAAGDAWTTPAAVLSPRPLILNQAASFPDSADVAVDGAGVATLLWREALPPGQVGTLLRATRVPAP